MKQYVTIDKRSKKAQKEYYSKMRGTWGELNPVTRSVPSGKTYNRNKGKQESRKIGKEFSDGFDVDFPVIMEKTRGFQSFAIGLTPSRVFYNIHRYVG